MAEDYDFSGYATKNDLKCSDGRVIRHNAFKENDGHKVPLVWMHGHNEPNNVLGHAVLENRNDGVYTYGYFNDTDAAENAKKLILHGDIDSMSIYANKLTEKNKNVVHGNIVEVSLVLNGANPGAHIDMITLRHSDGSMEDLDEAIIYPGEEGSIIAHSDEQSEDEPVETPTPNTTTEAPETTQELSHAAAVQASTKEAPVAEETVKDIFDTLTDKQKNVVYFIIGLALEGGYGDGTAAQSGMNYEEDYMAHSNSNIFEVGSMTGVDNSTELAHSAFAEAVSDAKSSRSDSFKETFLAHAAEYGIEGIDILFPDAKTIGDPEFIKRRDDWVADVLNGAHHSPFARVKSVQADITEDAARARGYIKGHLKKDEVFKLLKRVTTPTTIYKKQKLDRDDVIDITDLDVVAWMKGEMRGMLNEEIARAILVGDGRDISSEDKIDEEHIRPIWKDSDLFTIKTVLDATATTDQVIDEVVRGLENYEGKGTPTFYTTSKVVTDMLLLQDKIGRRLYETKATLASALRVSDIVEVPVLKGLTRTLDDNSKVDLVGLVVNMSDYNVGADKGGEINLFDDFDIDYNQLKYLMETRISGALTSPKTAIAIERKRA